MKNINYIMIDLTENLRKNLKKNLKMSETRNVEKSVKPSQVKYNFLCCEKAKTLSCVCLFSFSCPDHTKGPVCYGSHS